MKIKWLLRRIIAGFFIALILFSGCALWDLQQMYAAGERTYTRLAEYRPTGDYALQTAAGGRQDAALADASNAEVAALIEKYPDAAGWLSIPYTGVDYPFVQGQNNRYYLDRDMDGNYLAAGTLFMDTDNSPDFSDFNTIIYGHHMKDGSMLAGLDYYADPEFFKTHTKGLIYLENETKEVEFFAYVIASAADVTLYDNPDSDKGKQLLLAYIRDKARIYRDIGVSQEDKLVILSTCAYEFKDARLLLIGRL